MIKYLKKILIVSLVFISILITSTYFIGSYFVDYALVANPKSAKRMSTNDLSKEVKIINNIKNNEEILLDDFLNKHKLNDFTLNTSDGIKIYGHYLKQETYTPNWVIVVHGYQSSERRSLIIAKEFYMQGFNILTYNLRGHKPSESKYITMGYYDKYDLKEIMDFALELDSNAKILLHGTSMGGATVLLTAALNQNDQLVGVIGDCAYADLYTIFAKELKYRFNLPSFPVLDMANIMAKVKAKFNLKDVSPIKEVAKINVPILFIHTSGDDFISVNDTYDLANQSKDHRLYIAQGFGHADAYYADKEKYFSEINQFFKDFKIFQ